MATVSPLLHHDPVLDALRRAPIGEPLPPDVLAEIEEREAAIAAGHVKLNPQADVREKTRTPGTRQGQEEGDNK
jgi:hypothetical protein